MLALVPHHYVAEKPDFSGRSYKSNGRTVDQKFAHTSRQSRNQIGACHCAKRDTEVRDIESTVPQET